MLERFYEKYTGMFIGATKIVESNNSFQLYLDHLLRLIVTNDKEAAKSYIDEYPELLFASGTVVNPLSKIKYENITPFQLAFRLGNSEMCHTICDWIPTQEELAFIDASDTKNEKELRVHEVLCQIKAALDAQYEKGLDQFNVDDLIKAYDFCISKFMDYLNSKTDDNKKQLDTAFRALGQQKKKLPFHLLYELFTPEVRPQFCVPFFSDTPLPPPNQLRILNCKTQCEEDLFNLAHAIDSNERCDFSVSPIAFGEKFTLLQGRLDDKVMTFGVQDVLSVNINRLKSDLGRLENIASENRLDMCAVTKRISNVEHISTYQYSGC